MGEVSPMASLGSWTVKVEALSDAFAIVLGRIW